MKTINKPMNTFGDTLLDIEMAEMGELLDTWECLDTSILSNYKRPLLKGKGTKEEQDE